MAPKSLRLRVIWPPGDPANGANSEALLGWANIKNPGSVATEFGLQQGRSQIVPGMPQPDGSLVFETAVEPFVDKAGRQRFRGDCVQGPPGEPFLYLSWRVLGSPGWIGRRKVLLTPLTSDVLSGLTEEPTLATRVNALGHNPTGHLQEWVV